MAVKDSISKVVDSTMESILSIFNGRWLYPTEECDPPLNNELKNDNSQLSNVRQPSTLPVLPELKPELLPISPSTVADSRPGPSKFSQDGLPSSGSLHDLHVPKKMMEEFLTLAQENTAKGLETCGILAGSLWNRAFHVTTLIIPKQESTSYSCQTLNEEELFEVQDMHSLFPLGWIHTHPTQTCFMSSVDLHTHYSYQVMLPEAIAIIMAPMDIESTYGIYHLCDPYGIAVIRTCDLRGFHPHEDPDDYIYEHCCHVHLNPDSKFDVLDLR